jgi:hypothetical protein
MARYFFHIDAENPHHDEVGEDLLDDGAAWLTAMRLARDIESNLQPGAGVAVGCPGGRHCCLFRRDKDARTPLRKAVAGQSGFATFCSKAARTAVAFVRARRRANDATKRRKQMATISRPELCRGCALRPSLFPSGGISHKAHADKARHRQRQLHIVITAFVPVREILQVKGDVSRL